MLVEVLVEVTISNANGFYSNSRNYNILNKQLLFEYEKICTLFLVDKVFFIKSFLFSEIVFDRY